MAAKVFCTWPSLRSIQAGLRCASLRPAQVFSKRALMAASIRPSAKASQVFTAMRSRPAAGSSLPTGERLSKYSTMTRESNTASPPSINRQGTCPNGLLWRSVLSSAQGLLRTKSQSSFFSAKTTRTLRTKGLARDPINCMAAILRDAPSFPQENPRFKNNSCSGRFDGLNGIKHT